MPKQTVVWDITQFSDFSEEMQKSLPMQQIAKNIKETHDSNKKQKHKIFHLLCSVLFILNWEQTNLDQLGIRDATYDTIQGKFREATTGKE